MTETHSPGLVPNTADEFQDRVAVVTGGGSGIGRAVAMRWAAAGGTVVVFGRRQNALDDTVRAAELVGGKAEAVVCDVRDSDAVDVAIDGVVDRYGRLDALVNNAAGNFVVPSEDLSPGGWKAVVDIVLNGTFYCTRAAGRHMLATGRGTILNTIASYAWHGHPGTVHSAAAKAGVVAMTRTLAVEWGGTRRPDQLHRTGTDRNRGSRGGPVAHRAGSRPSAVECPGCSLHDAGGSRRIRGLPAQRPLRLRHRRGPRHRRRPMARQVRVHGFASGGPMTTTIHTTWDRNSILVGGDWIPVTDCTQVHDPATESVIGRSASAGADHVDAAVSAARSAGTAWGARAPGDRADILDDLCTHLRARRQLLVDTTVAEVGAPVTVAEEAHIDLGIEILTSYARLARDLPFRERLGRTLLLRRPAGVVACITPWNYPFYQLAAKVGAALAAGCTTVVKPAELTPLSTYLFADAALDAGVPPGVLNLVPGSGRTVGAALAAHPGVDVVSFTGSTAVGRDVAHAAAESLKRACLELGGKSASVVLGDAPLPAAVTATVDAAMLNSGQTCSAWTRLLVPRTRYEEAVELAAVHAGTLRVGDPRDRATQLGPVISAAQRRSIAAGGRRGGRRRGPSGSGRFRCARRPRNGPLPAADRARRRRTARPDRAQRDLRAGAGRPPARRRRGRDPARQRQRLRARRRRVVGRPGTGPERRGPDGHRSGRHQRRPVQPRGPVRRLEVLRPGPELGRFGVEEFTELTAVQR